jgi:hypothetical protein
LKIFEQRVNIIGAVFQELSFSNDEEEIHLGHLLFGGWDGKDERSGRREGEYDKNICLYVLKQNNETPKNCSKGG